MGRIIEALDVLFAPKKKAIDPTPTNVVIELADGRVIRPLLVRLPQNGHGPDHAEFVAYGPPSIGAFADCVLHSDALLSNTSLVVALLGLPGAKGGMMFAPMPMELVERVSGVQYHAAPAAQNVPVQSSAVHDRIGGSSVPS